jgi:hypothetical protein
MGVASCSVSKQFEEEAGQLREYCTIFVVSFDESKVESYCTIDEHLTSCFVV